jgi:hypothetical protein
MDIRDNELLKFGLANVTWWAYSPSFNLHENVMETEKPASKKNLLLYDLFHR